MSATGPRDPSFQRASEEALALGEPVPVADATGQIWWHDGVALHASEYLANEPAPLREVRREGWHFAGTRGIRGLVAALRHHHHLSEQDALDRAAKNLCVEPGEVAEAIRYDEAQA